MNDIIPDHRIRNPVPPWIRTWHLLYQCGLSGGGCLPGTGIRKICSSVCGHAEADPGNSGTSYPEYDFPALRTGLRAVYSGIHSLHLCNPDAPAHFPDLSGYKRIRFFPLNKRGNRYIRLPRFSFLILLPHCLNASPVYTVSSQNRNRLPA